MIWHIVTSGNVFICRRINHIFLTLRAITPWPCKLWLSIVRWSLSPRHLNLPLFCCCELINHSYRFLCIEFMFNPKGAQQKFWIGWRWVHQWNYSAIFSSSWWNSWLRLSDQDLQYEKNEFIVIEQRDRDISSFEIVYSIYFARLI